jgi:viroplasmin and RNaseH domain-containing protein
MRKLILLIFILVSSISFSQEKRYEFESIDVRTPDGWDIKKIKGEVVFYEDRKTNTISIITEHRNNKMYVKSNQMFIRLYSFLYTLVDDYGNESSIRIELENRSWDYIEFYFYSDRPGEKYFRLCLKRCK